jgi:flagellar hook-associated protein 1
VNTSYAIGISALNVGQRAIDLIGQNVANATTPGYHRQRVALVNRVVGDDVGGGVAIRRLTRYTSPPARTAILSSNAALSKLSARLDNQRQAEALFATGDGAIDGRLTAFFNQLEQLTTRPEDTASRRVAVDAAVGLGARFNALDTDLSNLRGSVFREAGTVVKEVNDLGEKIGALNLRISQVEAGGQAQANDLRDQRDELVNRMSQLVDVRVTEQENGSVNIIGANTPLVVGDLTTKLETTSDPAGNLLIRAVGTTTNLTVEGGRLAGLIQEHNVALPGYQARLDALATKLIEKVNSVQSTGLGNGAPFAQLMGSTTVANPATPLAAQGLAIPVQAGELRISITDTATGNRTLSTIAIDPTTQSLNDVAAAITAGTGGNVTGSVDALGRLQFTAAAGFTFDFAGRVPTPPNAVNMNGTSVPSVTGTYSGAANDAFNFQVVGSGTVGTTAGLSLEVRDAANNLVGTYNVGAGYQAGTPIAIKDGISVRLGAGTTNAGTFNTPLTADADTANLLPALGVNSLFTGSNAASIAVRSDIVADPTKLATTRSGLPGETSNLARLAALRDEKVLTGGTQTFLAHFGDTVGAVGTEVSGLDALETAQGNMQANLEAQEQSVIGVDINEEMVNLLTYQRMVESASRFLTVVNRSLDAVIDMVQ